jgi:hypothetical protein
MTFEGFGSGTVRLLSDLSRNNGPRLLRAM